ncbi:hypothetical protein HC766_02510 [Candidatus Gracilibacteria bacterium]|nr:hypothetical protein [Candidatus Gracilibacteria bacterium]
MAIDEDFNMDLIDHFGYEPRDFDTIADNHILFRETFEMEKSEKWFDLLKKKLPEYEIDSKVFKELSLSVNSNLSLMLTGLGNENNLYTGKCGHSHSAPLKFILPKIKTNQGEVILIDSVAGVDMLSYGLFMGVDMIITVVEPVKNSIKIANQIKELCKEIDLPVGFIINKSVENDLINSFVIENDDLILGKIPFNQSISFYKFSLIEDDLQDNLFEINQRIDLRKAQPIDQWTRLVEFENKKDSMKLYFGDK